MHRNRTLRRWAFAVQAAVCLAIVGAPSLRAQVNDAKPDELEEVGITEHLGDTLPLDVEFLDENGQPVTLGKYFESGRPVILTLNYSNCPMLCSLQLNGLFDGLRQMPEDWSMGQKFDMITISIDPTEPPQRAWLTRKKYLEDYGRTGSSAGYHCLTGRDENIRRVSDAVGFHYQYVAETNQYAHAAATMICTPDGRLSRYLYGVEYHANTLKMSLLEATDGEIGTTMDQVLMFCFHYDAESGRYAPAAFNLMRVGAFFAVTCVGGLILVYWRRERRKASSAAPSETAS